MNIQEKWINDFIGLGPAITHEGESVRPETRVSIAIGKVKELNDNGKGNLQAIVSVTGAKFQFKGFLNSNSPVATLLTEAKEKDAVVAVRFERKRKKDVDPRTPIMELTADATTARNNIVWIVAGVYNFNAKSWILTDDAVSNPDEDSAGVVAELSKAAYSTAGFFESDAPKISTTDKDWAVNHLVSMYTYLSEHNIDNELNLDDKRLKFVAKHLLDAVDHVQKKVKRIDTPNYVDYSHTKVRGMLFSWMRVNPLPATAFASKEAFQSWLNKFIQDSLSLWSWAEQEIE